MEKYIIKIENIEFSAKNQDEAESIAIVKILELVENADFTLEKV